MKHFFPVIGLAGFIAAGKTFAGQYLADRYDLLFVNADEIVRDLYLPGAEGYNELRRNFGKSFFINNDKNTPLLDRKKLVDFIMKDDQHLKQIEALIQPLVSRKIVALLQNNILPKAVCIEAIDFESSTFDLGPVTPDIIVWIDASKENLWERVRQRKGMTKKLFEFFLKHQKKPNKIDNYIENNKSLMDFKKKLDTFYTSGISNIGS